MPRHQISRPPPQRFPTPSQSTPSCTQIPLFISCNPSPLALPPLAGYQPKQTTFTHNSRRISHRIPSPPQGTTLKSDDSSVIGKQVLRLTASGSEKRGRNAVIARSLGRILFIGCVREFAGTDGRGIPNQVLQTVTGKSELFFLVFFSGFWRFYIHLCIFL